MARTLIPRQRFQGYPANNLTTGPPFIGVTPSTQTIDDVNGMQASNTGVEVLMVRTAAGESVNIFIISKPDDYGRTDDINEHIVASSERWYGPFTKPKFWGAGVDGANATVCVDATGMVGSPTIKWVRVG